MCEFYCKYMQYIFSKQRKTKLKFDILYGMFFCNLPIYGLHKEWSNIVNFLSKAVLA